MASVLVCPVLLLLAGTLLVQAVDPSPKPWPEQFHAQLVRNGTGTLAVIDLWYDWPNGRNFNIIQAQLGNLLYDLEWTNGTSFYYDLAAKSCKVITFAVGILRPDWLDSAHYLGVQQVGSFKCNVWEKADFITYYEDVETQRPVLWRFYTGREIHVITFEVGRVLKDEGWQAPSYCFLDEKQRTQGTVLESFMEESTGMDLLDASLHPWRRGLSLSG